MEVLLEGDGALLDEFRRYHPGLAYLYWIKARLGKAVSPTRTPPPQWAPTIPGRPPYLIYWLGHKVCPNNRVSMCEPVVCMLACA